MYKIEIPEAVEFQGTTEFETREDAVTAANELAIELGAELDVVTWTESGDKVIALVATPVRERNFRPFERVETPKFEAPAIEGYRAAYQRTRIQTVVYRRLDEKGWLVLDTRTNQRFEVATTAQAREITNRLAETA